MVWLTHSELLINFVIHNKPKVLIDLHQKVRDYPLIILLHG